ncbi:MAG: PD40 domain-containing protein [Cyclobacteriaceae bacterium]|nr:PD40 domain-containing protein [Cyclobacteriaceae bacterium HetDA_MAG_MS6]
MARSCIRFTLVIFIFGCSSLDKSINQGAYEQIISKYKDNLDKNNPELNYMVGEAYRKSNRIKDALPYYAAAIKEGVSDEEASYYYARSLKANSDYDQAKKVLEQYIARSRNQKVQDLARIELDNLDNLEDFKEKDTYYRVKNMEAINTSGAEYAPVYTNNYLYFTSNRDGGKIYKSTGTPFTDLYRIRTKGANANVRTLEALDPAINHADVNEGSITISKDGTSIIFAKGNTGKVTGNNEVNLYFTRFRNGTWLEPRPLSINDPDAWDSTPTLSPDGTTLYFSSTRDGGYGGADIYSAKLNRRGRWVDVRNLGPEINTPGNEMFPFVSDDGSLYFASDKHPGFGNLDIFKAERRRGHITIENLGRPMNSSADDFGLYEFNLTRGFFSSNRRGGKGDDDVYTFVNDDPNLRVVNYFLTGTTVTADDGGEEITVSNTKVTLVGEDGSILDEAFTGEDGQFNFRVYSEEKYELIGEKTDYFTTRKKFSTIGKSVDRTKLTEFITNVDFETSIFLDRIVIEKPVVLNNIYYDLDKWDIRPDAAVVLDSMVTIMEDNPEIYIELGSHTDVRADDSYNLDLSWKRARSAVSYIIQKGVDATRITAKGYGETVLIVSNAKTEEEHQRNRRTEFKVLRYNPKDRSEDLPPDEELDEYDRFFSPEDFDDQ